MDHKAVTYSGYVLNAPGLSKINFLAYCSELRVPHTILKHGSLVDIDGDACEFRCIFFESISKLFQNRPNLRSNDRIFVADSPVTASIHGLSSVGAQLNKAADHFYSDNSFIEVYEITYPIFRKLLADMRKVSVHRYPILDPVAELIKENVKAAVLAPILHFMYRLDKETDRPLAQQLAYSYLFGKYKRIPPALNAYPFLVKLLQDEKAQTLRNACIFLTESGEEVDSVAVKFDVDRFEISYLRSRLQNEGA